MRGRWIVAVVGMSVIGTSTALGQPAPGGGGPIVNESSVGYIDSAIPGNQLRFRYDTAYDFRRPTRAEFFYALSGPLGPGLPFPESSLDYQELSTYMEVLLAPELSVFMEVPIRFLNPEINANHQGLGDLIVGGKYAFLYECDRVVSAQLKVYLPTGDEERGLGTDHWSLEPGLLAYQRLDSGLTFEGELRYWIPIDGTEDFAGSVLRYGAGVSYDLLTVNAVTVAPVVEVVGWTPLDGREAILHPSGRRTIEDAEGHTVVNAKAGVRFRLNGVGDLYAGYGRALTGHTWYEDVYRVELRVFF